MKVERKAKRNVLDLISLFFIAAIYFITISKHLVTGDSKELSATAAAIGIAHPTGYSIYVILGHLFYKVFGFLEPEFLFNLFSLVTTISALYLLNESLRYFFVTPFVRSITIITYALTTSIWQYAVTAEVYALNHLFFAAVFFFVTRASKAEVKTEFLRNAQAAFFLGGMSLGAHMTSGVLLPALVFWYFLTSKQHSLRSYTQIASLLGCYALGSTVLLIPLYLDGRSRLNYLEYTYFQFPKNLSSLTSKQRWWWLVSGRQYGAMQVYTISKDTGEALSKFETVLYRTFFDNVCLHVLAISGILCSYLRVLIKPEVIYLLIPSFSLTFYFSLYLAFEPINTLPVYFLSAVLCAFFLMYFGPPIQRVVCLGLIIFLPAQVYRTQQEAREYFHPQFDTRVKDFISKLPLNSIVYFPAWNDFTEGISQQFLHQQREDLKLVNIGDLWEGQFKQICEEQIDNQFVYSQGDEMLEQEHCNFESFGTGYKISPKKLRILSQFPASVPFKIGT